tara:strand:+ start:191 stop:493 length:303 start_codon:yes stop_codon:yes gene_type:complete
VKTSSKETETLLISLFKEIEYISIRTSLIKKKYNRIISKNLKDRFFKEYKYLQNKFKEAESKVNIIDKYLKDDFSFNKILKEKCLRTKSELYENNSLFFV